MKVAVLWKVWNDYLEASLDELAQQGHQVLLCELAPRDRYATPLERYADIGRFRPDEDGRGLERALQTFDPDLLVVCSWDVRRYRSVARSFRRRCPRLVYMDNQWHGTLRQWLGVATAPLHLWRCYDGAFVTSERQARFARRLGYGNGRSQTGGIVADTRKFSGRPAAHGFIFVGRLVPAKSVDLLATAYSTYRGMVDDPWTLTVCGDGPLREHLTGVEGVDVKGFLAPAQLAQQLRSSSCLVLPSHFEPYGVVVHEATSVGLHVIASEAVGAADDFVRDSVNGRVVRTDDAAALADAMLWMHQRTEAQLIKGQQVSQQLAALRSPATWVRDLLLLASRFDTQRGLLRAAVRRG